MLVFKISMLILSIWMTVKIFAEKNRGHGVLIKLLTTFTTGLWIYSVWSEVSKLIQ